MTPQDVLTASTEQIREWCALLDGYQRDEDGWLSPAGKIDLLPPDYTGSLDDVWPLQEETLKKGVWAFYEALWLVIFEDEVDAVIASAEQRARAICLARLDELEELVK